MLEINTSKQEEIAKKFLIEKEEKIKSYKMLEESEGGIKFLFEKAPFLISTLWLMYRVEGKENTLKKIIAYEYDYKVRQPNNFQYAYLKYFLNLHKTGRDELKRSRESIYDFISYLEIEIDRLEELVFGFDRYRHNDGEDSYESYIIIDDEFRERVMLPLSQGEFDEVLEREITKFIMIQNLKIK